VCIRRRCRKAASGGQQPKMARAHQAQLLQISTSAEERPRRGEEEARWQASRHAVTADVLRSTPVQRAAATNARLAPRPQRRQQWRNERHTPATPRQQRAMT